MPNPDDFKKAFSHHPLRSRQIVCDLAVTPEALYLTSWFLQTEGITKPAGGFNGGSTFGDDLAPRLSGKLYHCGGVSVVPWDGGRMVMGTVWYLFIAWDSTPAAEEERFLEVADLAALVPTEVRQAAKYPHWHHPIFVEPLPMITALGRPLHHAATVRIGRLDRTGDIGGFTAPNVYLRTVGHRAAGFVGAFDWTREDVLFMDRSPGYVPSVSVPDMPDGWVLGWEPPCPIT